MAIETTFSLPVKFQTMQYVFVGIVLADSSGNNASTGDLSTTQHALVCATHELGCLIKSLGTSAAPLVAEASSSKYIY